MGGAGVFLKLGKEERRKVCNKNPLDYVGEALFELLSLDKS